MRPWLRAALLLCPPDFRSEYEAQIVADAENARWTPPRNALRVCAGVAASGVMLHAENGWRNVSFAVRVLRKAPLYTLVSLAAIALAVGANLAIVSVVENVLLKPLPYPDPGRLFLVSRHDGAAPLSFGDERALVARGAPLATFAIAKSESATLTGHGRLVVLDGRRVDARYFGVLGAHAELGRLIDGRDTGTTHVVIADSVWRAYFGADAAVVGRQVRLDGNPFTIVGVAQPGFRDPSGTDDGAGVYWIPIDPRLPDAQRNFAVYSAIGRLQPGASVVAAQAGVRRIFDQLDRAVPGAARNGPARLTPLLSGIVGDAEPLLWLLYAAVAVLLLIACANVANLALVRAAAREREISVRAALGASRARIVVQLCTESAVIAGAGGILGVLLGWGGLRAFASAGARMIPRWSDVRIDAGALLYAVVVLAVVVAACGVLPALRRGAAAAAAARTRSNHGSRTAGMRSALVIAEVALAFAVVTSAALLTRSFTSLTHVPVGFDGRNVVEIDNVGLPRSTMADPHAKERAAQRYLDELQRIPGVLAAAASFDVPFNGAGSNPERALHVPTSVPAAAAVRYEVKVSDVTPDYFHVLRIPVLYGRQFTRADTLAARPVAVVNAAFARRYFGTVNAVGRSVFPQISSRGTVAHARTIVGISGDTRYRFGEPFVPIVYMPLAQLQFLRDFIVQTDGRDAGLAQAVSDVVARIDPDAPRPTVTPYRDFFDRAALRSRAAAMLFGALAVIALGLALAGIFAVTSTAVQQHVPEFGLRKAIGATDRDIIRGVLARTARDCALGIALGVVLTALCSRLLAPVLFETSPFDPPMLAAAAGVLCACTLLAATLPALRAMRVDPAPALRYE